MSEDVHCKAVRTSELIYSAKAGLKGSVYVDYIKIREGLNEVKEAETVALDVHLCLNANENHLPLPETIRKALADMAGNFNFSSYPQLKGESLCRLIAEDLCVDKDKVRVGGGVSEMLTVACYAFGGPGRKIALPYPEEEIYSIAATRSGSEVVYYPLNLQGNADEEALELFCREEQPDLLIVNNPHNLLGSYNSLATIEKIVATANCPVIIDESYMEFAKGEGVDPQDMRPLRSLKKVAGSGLAVINKYSNLMVLRSFSAAYGMAGLRCSYAVGSSAMTRVMGKGILPYSVPSFSLAAASLCYKNREEFTPNIEEVREQRELMNGEFMSYGLDLWPSETNFICFKPGTELINPLGMAYDRRYGRSNNFGPMEKAGKFIYRQLLEKGILVHDLTAHPSLGGSLRITVGTAAENAEALSVIKAATKVAEDFISIN